jgi:hypothetical protein
VSDLAELLREIDTDWRHTEPEPDYFDFLAARLIAAGVTLAATPVPLDDGVRVIDVDAWLPQHLGYCANRPEDECSCGVGPEYERMLATAYAATPAPHVPHRYGDHGWCVEQHTAAPLDVAMRRVEEALPAGWFLTDITHHRTGPGEHRDWYLVVHGPNFPKNTVGVHGVSLLDGLERLPAAIAAAYAEEKKNDQR